MRNKKKLERRLGNGNAIATTAIDFQTTQKKSLTTKSGG